MFPVRADSLTPVDIRRLGRGDGQELREVRLRALSDAPYAFSSSFGRESGLAPEFWEQRVAESERDEASVFLAVEDGCGLGMAGGFFAEEARRAATLWGMWVDPAARRGGIAQALVQAVIGWARACGADHLRLAVTDCEESAPAAGLYRKLGFTDTGEREFLEWDPSLATRVLSRAL